MKLLHHSLAPAAAMLILSLGCGPQGASGSSGSSSGAGASATGSSVKAATAAVSSAPSATTAAAATASAAPSAPAGPVTLASGQKDVAGLALAGTSLFWVDRGAGVVMSVPVAGGTPTVLAKDLKEPVSLATNDTTVYVGTWGDNPTTKAQLLSIPRAGGAATVVAEAEFPIGSVAIVADEVVFTSAGLVSAVKGADKRSLVNVAPNAALVATADGGVFVGAWPISMQVTSPTGTLSLVGLDGSQKKVASALPGPNAVVADASGVYWLNGGVESEQYEGSIMALRSGSDAPTKLAALGPWSGGSRALAVDDQRVYWATERSIVAAAKSGGAPATVVEDARQVRHLVKATGAIYWATGDTIKALSL